MEWRKLKGYDELEGYKGYEGLGGCDGWEDAMNGRMR